MIRIDFQARVIGVQLAGLSGIEHLISGLFGKEQLFAVVVAEVQDHPIVEQIPFFCRIRSGSQIRVHYNVLAGHKIAIDLQSGQVTELDIAIDLHPAMSLTRLLNDDILSIVELASVDDNLPVA